MNNAYTSCIYILYHYLVSAAKVSRQICQVLFVNYGINGIGTVIKAIHSASPQSAFLQSTCGEAAGCLYRARVMWCGCWKGGMHYAVVEGYGDMVVGRVVWTWLLKGDMVVSG